MFFFSFLIRGEKYKTKSLRISPACIVILQDQFYNLHGSDRADMRKYEFDIFVNGLSERKVSV